MHLELGGPLTLLPSYREEVFWELGAGQNRERRRLLNWTGRMRHGQAALQGAGLGTTIGAFFETPRE